MSFSALRSAALRAEPDHAAQRAAFARSGRALLDRTPRRQDVELRRALNFSTAAWMRARFSGLRDSSQIFLAIPAAANVLMSLMPAGTASTPLACRHGAVHAVDRADERSKVVTSGPIQDVERPHR